ncbi:unnamed protein product [Dracunculus medinensis]|uniref:Uncharacterized protein n=1 Tax=Dracunculus medinensis TaxID=318479 RepID=A0A0N4UJQ5_DRAME|nr:unnamed protein product [Dracunculus medinensis]
MGESVESKRSNQAAPNKISQYKDTSLANWEQMSAGRFEFQESNRMENDNTDHEKMKYLLELPLIDAQIIMDKNFLRDTFENNWKKAK